MQYQIEAVSPGAFRMNADVISRGKRTIYDRVKVLTGRKQQCRVREVATGRLLSSQEIEDLGR